MSVNDNYQLVMMSGSRDPEVVYENLQSNGVRGCVRTRSRPNNRRESTDVLQHVCQEWLQQFSVASSSARSSS